MEYFAEKYKVRIHELAWQKMGLQQTASGYGNKLTTRYMLQTNDGIWRRVYAICYSNVASFYIQVKGQKTFLRDSELQEAIDMALGTKRVSVATRQ